MFDINRLVSRKTAAEIYGCSASAIDSHVLKGYLVPVFDDGHIRLYDMRQVLALKARNLHRGRPSKKHRKLAVDGGKK